MRELVYYIATSLDGRIAGPQGEFDAFPLEGDHMEHVLGRYADALPTSAAAHLGIEQTRTRFSTVLMGWNTYAVGLPDEVSPYRHLEQIVFSHRAHPGAENLTVTDDDPRAVVDRFRGEQGTGIWLCGGGSLAAQLLDRIDRIVLKINPLVLGAGVPILEDSSYLPALFELEESTAFDSGVIIAEYVRRR